MGLAICMLLIALEGREYTQRPRYSNVPYLHFPHPLITTVEIFIVHTPDACVVADRHVQKWALLSIG